MVYITGDTHGNFSRLFTWRDKHVIEFGDTVIILGDAGFNYWLNLKDRVVKEKVNRLRINIFCIHGNHEARPETIDSYEIDEYWGGKVYVEPEYPYLKFAIDGEIYNIPGKDGKEHPTIVIGGAYSIDKYYRIYRMMQWFPDEQPSDDIKDKVEEVLAKRNWDIDTVLTHTAPLVLEPTEWFMEGIDQSNVDKSTEEWLQSILEKLNHFDRWYLGHYHGDKKSGNITFMFKNIEEF